MHMSTNGLSRIFPVIASTSFTSPKVQYDGSSAELPLRVVGLEPSESQESSIARSHPHGATKTCRSMG